ncbi:MAG: 4Fe-4S dicluster domain-containing protein [Anaerolineae bacterium]
MDTPLLLLDATQCVECDLCSLACSLAKVAQADVKVARVRIVRHWPDYPDLNICRHWRCDSKACIDACPPEAIELEDGVLFIDPHLCTGCGECIPACPYGAIHMNELDWVAVACDLCGGAPACAPACPTGALVFEASLEPGRKGDSYVHQ